MNCFIFFIYYHFLLHTLFPPFGHFIHFSLMKWVEGNSRNSRFMFLFYISIWVLIMARYSILKIGIISSKCLSSPNSNNHCREADCVIYIVKLYNTLRNLWEIKGQFPLPEYWKLRKENIWAFTKKAQEPGNKLFLNYWGRLVFVQLIIQALRIADITSLVSKCSDLHHSVWRASDWLNERWNRNYYSSTKTLKQNNKEM